MPGHDRVPPGGRPRVPRVCRVCARAGCLWGPINGSTALPRDAMRQASGGAVMTNMVWVRKSPNLLSRDGGPCMNDACCFHGANRQDKGEVQLKAPKMRGAEITKWIIPSDTLALMPKCPVLRCGLCCPIQWRWHLHHHSLGASDLDAVPLHCCLGLSRTGSSLAVGLEYETATLVGLAMQRRNIRPLLGTILCH